MMVFYMGYLRPIESNFAGSFDTYLPEDRDSYRGAWGVYPLLPSGNILVSDMQSGLFVLSPLENQNSSTNLLEKNYLYFQIHLMMKLKFHFQIQMMKSN